jgi:hypothetical protein
LWEGDGQSREAKNNRPLHVEISECERGEESECDDDDDDREEQKTHGNPRPFKYNLTLSAFTTSHSCQSNRLSDLRYEHTSDCQYGLHQAF